MYDKKQKTTENEYLNEICRFYLRRNHRREFRHHGSSVKMIKWIVWFCYQDLTILNTDKCLLFILHLHFRFSRSLLFTEMWLMCCNAESLFQLLNFGISFWTNHKYACEVSFCGLMRKIKANVMFFDYLTLSYSIKV